MQHNGMAPLCPKEDSCELTFNRTYDEHLDDFTPAKSHPQHES